MNAEEIVNKVATSYTSETRSVVEGTINECAYLTEDGRKCAVGMFMLDPGLLQSQNPPAAHVEESIGMPLDDLLIPEVRGFPVAFWSRLQHLHDKPYHWTPTGLSAIGIESANSIIEEFSQTGATK